MTVKQIASALQILRPGAQWVVRGETYADIEWLDLVQTKPTEPEVTALAPTAEATYLTTSTRADAVTNLLSNPSPDSKFIRAVLLTILDEVNVIRSLLPGPPAPRTAAQFRTAVQNKINAGAAD